MRIHVRMNKAQKSLIQKAADLEGCSIEEFIVQRAEAAARRVTEGESAILELNERDTQIFVNAILNPAEPGPVLRSAADQYKQIFGES